MVKKKCKKSFTFTPQLLLWVYWLAAKQKSNYWLTHVCPTPDQQKLNCSIFHHPSSRHLSVQQQYLNTQSGWCVSLHTGMVMKEKLNQPAGPWPISGENIQPRWRLLVESRHQTFRKFMRCSRAPQSHQSFKQSTQWNNARIITCVLTHHATPCMQRGSKRRFKMCEDMTVKDLLSE